VHQSPAVISCFSFARKIRKSDRKAGEEKTYIHKDVQLEQEQQRASTTAAERPVDLQEIPGTIEASEAKVARSFSFPLSFSVAITEEQEER